MKRHLAVLPAPRELLSSLQKQSMSPSDSDAYIQFLKKLDEYFSVAQKVWEKCGDEAKEEGTPANKEWVDYLNEDIEMPKLPASLLSKVQEITPAAHAMLKSLMVE